MSDKFCSFFCFCPVGVGDSYTSWFPCELERIQQGDITKVRDALARKLNTHAGAERAYVIWFYPRHALTGAAGALASRFSALFPEHVVSAGHWFLVERSLPRTHKSGHFQLGRSLVRLAEKRIKQETYERRCAQLCLPF